MAYAQFHISNLRLRAYAIRPYDILMKKHKNRQSIRLRGYDYAQAGWYFVTICIQDFKEVLGEGSKRYFSSKRMG